MHREYPIEAYNRWWVGKRCRPAGFINLPFKLVVSVRWEGAPSQFYGTCVLEYDDGTEATVHPGEVVPPCPWLYHSGQAYKPRKCDVEVEAI